MIKVIKANQRKTHLIVFLMGVFIGLSSIKVIGYETLKYKDKQDQQTYNNKKMELIERELRVIDLEQGQRE